MFNCQLIDSGEKLNSLVDFLKDEEIIACDLEASGLDTKLAKLEGIGLGTSSKQYFISYSNGFSIGQVKKVLVEIFKDKRVIFHNAKFDLKLLYENGLPWPEKFDDTMIMSWLVDEEGQHGLKPLAKAIFGRESKKWNQLDRRISLFRNDADIAKELSDYCGEDVKNTYDLYFHFLPILKAEGLIPDYEKIELKLIPVLVQMELRGIKIDTKWLKKKQE